MRCRVILLILPGLLALPGPGCETVDDLVPEPVVHTPLAFDPTEDYDIDPWWSNGEQMLRLDEAGSYALYATQNRYEKPTQRGRWDHQSYAVVRLEPYGRFRQEWIRGAVSRIDGEIAITILDMEPMFAIDGAPAVPEDAVVGRWKGSAGTLLIGPNMRYELSPAVTEIDQPAVIAGHSGRWRLEDDYLLLEPDAPNMGPLEFEIVAEEGETVLKGPTGEFRRVRTPRERSNVAGAPT